jgi:hypothetical protein
MLLGYMSGSFLTPPDRLKNPADTRYTRGDAKFVVHEDSHLVLIYPRLYLQVPTTYAALLDFSTVPASTLWHCEYGTLNYVGLLKLFIR